MRVLIDIPTEASERLNGAVKALTSVVTFPTSPFGLSFVLFQNVACGVLLVWQDGRWLSDIQVYSCVRTGGRPRVTVGASLED